MRSSKSRSRSKQNRPRTLGNIINRVFDSSGPEGKVRGTPQQIIEKYQLLARDAQLSNDRVAAENFLQHAEHYTRLLAEANRELAAEQEVRQSYQQNPPGNGNGNRPANDRDYRTDPPRSDNRTDEYSEDQPYAGGPAAFEVIGEDDAGLVELPEFARPAQRREYAQDRPRTDRPADNRASDNRGGDNRGGDNRQNENRQADNRQGENRQAENRPESRPRDDRPYENRSRSDRPRPTNANSNGTSGANANDRPREDRRPDQNRDQSRDQNRDQNRDQPRDPAREQPRTPRFEKQQSAPVVDVIPVVAAPLVAPPVAAQPVVAQPVVAQPVVAPPVVAPSPAPVALSAPQATPEAVVPKPAPKPRLRKPVVKPADGTPE